MKTTNLKGALMLGLLGAGLAFGANGQIVSDDFNKATLKTSLWTWIDPVGDTTYEIDGFGTTDVVLTINVPPFGNHDAWVNNYGEQIMQKAPDKDFEVVAKFETVPHWGGQQEGILVKDASGTNFLRFCLQSNNGQLVAYIISVINGSGNTMANGTWAINITSVATPSDGNGLAYMKLNRTGNQWTYSVSPDNTVWETVYAPVTQAFTVAQIGPYCGDSGNGMTAVVDYFFNTASPILKEDGQNALPTVSITNLVDGATFAAPTNLVVKATAADSDGTVAEVDFSVNGTQLSSTTAKPYNFNWSPTVGVYSVVATAIDNAGGTSSTAPMTIIVTGTGGLPVSDDFSQPTLDSTLWTTVNPQNDGTFQIVGSGSADSHLNIIVPSGANHDPWINNQALRVIQTIPDQNFEVEARFDSLPNTAGQTEGFIVQDDFGDYLRLDVMNDGSSSLQAFVGAIINNGGAQVSRTPITDVPMPTLGNLGTVFLKLTRVGNQFSFSTSPDGKAWTLKSTFVQYLPVSGVGLLAANNDNTGHNNPPQFPVLVDYFFNSLAPIALEDGQGPNTPPTVTMTGPADHLLYTVPAHVPLTVNAADSDGSVLKVEYYAGANLIGTATTAPFSFTWDVTDPGFYSVSAVATDNRGAATVAGPVLVLVGGPGVVPVSDDFNEASLNTTLWTPVDPVGDCAFQVTGNGTGDAHLQIILPAGTEHDGWTVNNMARLMQPIADQDFEIEVKFDSMPAVASAEEGIVVEDANGNELRWDVANNATWDSNPSMMHWVGRGIGSSSPSGIGSVNMTEFPKSTNGQVTIYGRVRRQGTTWTSFTSPDGVTWTKRIQFTDSMTPVLAGISAGNGPGTSAPAFTASVDYFFNSLTPIVAEDGQLPIGPKLAATVSGKNIVISWPVAAGFGLESAASLGATNWSSVTTAPTVVGTTNTVTLPVGSGASFYRLKK